MSWHDSGFRFPPEFEQLEREGRFGLSRSDAEFRWIAFMWLDGAALLGYNLILSATGHLAPGDNLALNVIKYGMNGVGLGALGLANIYRRGNKRMASMSQEQFDKMHRSL